MKTSLKKYFIISGLGLSFFAWQSCKERTVASPDLIPGVDNIHTFELQAADLGITLQPGVLDSQKTNDVNNEMVGLGRIPNDPFFGSITSGAYIQFVPPSFSFAFPDPATTTFDSAVLALPYAHFSYGDTSNPAANYQYFKVYRVTEPMTQGAAYYTGQSFAFNPAAPIGGGSASLKSLSDTFAVAGDTLSGQMRIKMDYQFIRQFIVAADSASLVSADAFLSYMNGFYIMPADTPAPQNRLSFFNLSGSVAASSARIDFFFHNNSTGAAQLVSFPYISGTSAFVNKVAKNYTGKPAAGFVNAAPNRDSVLIQGYPGFYTQITLRNLDQIPAAVINKAQLTLTAIPVGGDNMYAPPSNLVLEKVNDDGSVSPIADVLGASGSPSTGGMNFMNGVAAQVVINGNTYTQYALNFPRELQNTLKAGKTALTLRIRSSSLYVGAFRMVAPGLSGNPDTKLKISIIYTKAD